MTGKTLLYLMFSFRYCITSRNSVDSQLTLNSDDFTINLELLFFIAIIIMRN